MTSGCVTKGVRRKRGWWDSECKEQKIIVKRELRRWRKKGGDGKLYREAKGKYKKLIEGKKKEERERWERESREIRTEGQVWEIVNRGRRKRRKVNKHITMEEWDGYFRNLLGGVDSRVGRQGCPLSPHLFNLITADMEEVMSRGGWGGVKLGGMKIYTLAYVDDVVLIAEEEDGMRSIIERLEGYLEKKGLELNVWGMGKRKFKNDWGRRLWLFDKLEWTVIGYGMEMWGWRERKELEKLQERYLRWMLGMEWETPGYMVRENLQREKLRDRAGRRA
ncbi:hypothetical protein ACFW04_008652 [Cataglyphis niger]